MWSYCFSKLYFHIGEGEIVCIFKNMWIEGVAANIFFSALVLNLTVGHYWPQALLEWLYVLDEYRYFPLGIKGNLESQQDYVQIQQYLFQLAQNLLPFQKAFSFIVRVMWRLPNLSQILTFPSSQSNVRHMFPFCLYLQKRTSWGAFRGKTWMLFALV